MNFKGVKTKNNCEKGLRHDQQMSHAGKYYQSDKTMFCLLLFFLAIDETTSIIMVI